MSRQLFSLVSLSLLSIAATIAQAQTETVIVDFAQSDYGNPQAGLISDAAGNLYGTAMGVYLGFYGEVFQLKPGSGGTWTYHALHDFTGSDGNGPIGGLVMDGLGKLYGTTVRGGNYNNGVVYQLKPTSTGTWDFSVIHNFQYDGYTYFDGAQPLASLIVDKKGRLYGTTNFGGNGPCYDNGLASHYPAGLPPVGCGTVFELIPGGSGTWVEKILYNFQGGTDGALPTAALMRDRNGDLYGTTTFGGVLGNKSCVNTMNIGGCGVVFSLIRGNNGTYTQNTPYTFQGQSDGANPTSSVIFDRAGNLYGTAAGAGDGFFSNSAVFELSPSSTGTWIESTIFEFSADGSNTGIAPLAGLIFDAAGNLYGTTYWGTGPAGTSSSSVPPPKLGGGGVVFKLSFSGGAWTQTVLHSFSGNPDGYTPGYGNLLLRKGVLYGVTAGGGAGNLGVIYQLVP